MNKWVRVSEQRIGCGRLSVMCVRACMCVYTVKLSSYCELPNVLHMCLKNRPIISCGFAIFMRKEAGQ